VRKKRDDIPGFDIIEKNTKIGQEGLLIAARQGTFTSIEEVKSDNFNNIFGARIKYINETVRLVVVHGPQESDSVETRTAFFEEIAVQVERCDMAGDQLILLGDFNARIEEQEDEVVALSPNGKLLREILAEHNLNAVNFQPQSTGVWTRIQKMNDGTVNKSTIDYVLTKVENLTLVDDMVVDEAKLFCPYRESASKNTKNIVFSDHCVIILTINIQMSAHTDNGASYKTWNYTEEGYTTYKIESVEQMDAKWSPDSTQAYDFWTIEFEKLLSRCFTKKTIKMGAANNSGPVRNRSVRNILADVAKRGKIQRKIVKGYLERVIEIEVRQETLIKAAKLKQTMANLTEQEKFSPNGYWKMKKAADRNLKIEPVYSIIKENGVEVTGGKAINEAYREEFQHRLRTREPHDGWGEYVDEVNSVIRNWLNSESPSSPPFSDEELDKVIARLKKGKSPGLDDYPPDLFIYAGPGTRKSLLQLLNQIKEARNTPDQWDSNEDCYHFQEERQQENTKILPWYFSCYRCIKDI
jgi:exonuclease III